MPKATLTFDLPMEEIEFLHAVKGTELYLVITDALEKCRYLLRALLRLVHHGAGRYELVEGMLRDVIEARGLTDVVNQ